MFFAKNGNIRWRLLSAVFAVVAVLGFAAPAKAENTPRAFDAVTTQWENGIWKHLGLKRDRFVIFNDRIVYEQGVIRSKWPFLPSHFHTDLDAAAVIMEGRQWRYIFVKNNQVAMFTDGGLVSGGWRPLSFLPEPYRSDMDALSAYYSYNVPTYLATKGSAVLQFDDGRILGSGQFANVLPADFRSDWDDVSVEQEGDAFKVSLYKGYERLIYLDSLFGSDYVVERLDVRNKWPQLRSFFDATV